jgi:hypothetical protein
VMSRRSMKVATLTASNVHHFRAMSVSSKGVRVVPAP